MYFQTNSIIEGINLAYGRDASPWPGHSYDSASEESQALQGTPNGSSIAYMLIQHRRELGHKNVEKITVFYHKEEYLMLLFNIVDVNPTSNEQARTESKQVCTLFIYGKSLSHMDHQFSPVLVFIITTYFIASNFP